MSFDGSVVKMSHVTHEFKIKYNQLSKRSKKLAKSYIPTYAVNVHIFDGDIGFDVIEYCIIYRKNIELISSDKYHILESLYTESYEAFKIRSLDNIKSEYGKSR